MKTKKKLLLKFLLDRTLQKNTGLNLCLSKYIKIFVSVFIYSLIRLSFHQARLKKYFYLL